MLGIALLSQRSDEVLYHLYLWAAEADSAGLPHPKLLWIKCRRVVHKFSMVANALFPLCNLVWELKPQAYSWVASRCGLAELQKSSAKVNSNLVGHLKRDTVTIWDIKALENIGHLELKYSVLHCLIATFNLQVAPQILSVNTITSRPLYFQLSPSLWGTSTQNEMQIFKLLRYFYIAFVVYTWWILEIYPFVSMLSKLT